MIRGAVSIVVAATAIGYLIGDVEGALLALVVGVVGAAGRPAVGIAGAAILLAAAAVATLVETPLGGSPASVGPFPVDRELSHSLGRLAGVALVTAVLLLAWRERGREPSPRRAGGPSLRSRVAAGWPRRLVPIAVFTVAAGAVIAYSGEQLFRAWLPALILVVAAAGLLAVREAGRSGS